MKDKFLELYGSDRYYFWLSDEPDKIHMSMGGAPVNVEDARRFPTVGSHKINVDMINSFIDEGYLTPSDFKPWSRDGSGPTIHGAIKTYKARRLILDESGFDLDKWQSRWHSKLCCERAIPMPCVCTMSYSCDVHGGRCHGTHD